MKKYKNSNTTHTNQEGRNWEGRNAFLYFEKQRHAKGHNAKVEKKLINSNHKQFVFPSRIVDIYKWT